MRKLIIFVSLCIFFQITKAQKLNSYKDSVNYELSYIRYNLNKFHKQHKIGLILLISGTSVSILSSAAMPALEDPQQMLVPVGIGSALVTAGTIVMLDSYRFIGRASIKPTRYGLKFIIDF